MLLREPPVTEPRVPPWRQAGPRRALCDQHERFYKSVYASQLRDGDAEAADLTQPFGVRQPGAPGKRTEPRHQAVILRALSAHAETFPLHIRTYAIPALALIHHERRAAIEVCYLQGVPVPHYAQVARVNGVSNSTVQSWLDKGVWDVVTLLFDSHGHPLVPQELR